MPRDNRVQRAPFRRCLHIAVCLTALLPAVAHSQTISQQPRVSWELVAGGAGGRAEPQPTVRGAFSVRLGSGPRVSPFATIELADTRERLPVQRRRVATR